MILAVYFARRWLAMAGILVAVVATLMILIDMVELIRAHAGSAMTARDAAALAALRAPRTLYQMLPLLVLVATVALFLALARSSELVVVRAAGRSALRAAAAPAAAAFLLGVAAVALINPLVAATARTHDQRLAEITAGRTALLQLSPEGLWLRQASEGGQTLIRASRSNANGTVLYDATFLTFDADGTPRARIAAAEAALEPGRWLLADAKEWRLDAANPEREATLRETAELATDLTPDRIRDSFGSAIDIAIWDLPAFIASLERAGFSAREHRVWLQMELAQPLLLAAMVLLAAGFTMRHSRLGRTGPRVLGALIAGFALFVLRNFAQLLGNQGQIPIALAAWSPPAVTLFFAVGLILALEDG
jgi:lipopolysaccharide export system permease protein